MWTIALPLTATVSKNKSFSLNLNQYRNEHYQSLNKAKVNFTAHVAALIAEVPYLDQVRLHYVVFARSKQLVDTMNIGAIVDKFFCDALVEHGRLSDDNCLIVVGHSFEFGGVDKGNPRVEVTIEPVGSTPVPPPVQSTSTERHMQILLDQPELEEAVRLFVTNQVTVNEDKRIDIAFSATRGEKGFTATINIVNADAPQHVAAAAPAAEPAPPATPPPAPQTRTRRLTATTTSAKPAATTEAAAIRDTPEDRVDPAQAVTDEAPFNIDDVSSADVPEFAENEAVAQEAAETLVEPAEDRDLGVAGGAPLKRSSIFGVKNLGKPTNAGAATTDA